MLHGIILALFEDDGTGEGIFRKKMFRFNIEGLGRSEIETYDHTLTLYTLPAGTYRVMASCSTEDGGWSQSRCILQIEVVPPWWKSFWFIALVVIVAAGLCYLMISYTVKRKKFPVAARNEREGT